MRDTERYIQVDKERFGDLNVHTRRLATERELIDVANEIMREQRNSFIINIQLGYILKDIATQNYSLFYAGWIVFERRFFQGFNHCFLSFRKQHIIV